MDSDVNCRSTYSDADTCTPVFEDADSFDDYVCSLQAGGTTTEEVLGKVLLCLTKDTRHGILSTSLTTSFAQGDTKDQVLREITSYMHTDLYDEKFVFVVSPLDSVVCPLAVCAVRQTGCTVAVSGVDESHFRMEDFLARMIVAIEPIIRQDKPQFVMNLMRLLPIHPPPADLGLFFARNAFKLIGNETKLPLSGNKRHNTGMEFLYEWHTLNAKDAEDVDDEEDQDEEGPESNYQNDEDSSRFFDLDDLGNKMSKIDLGDDASVKVIVASALKDEERDAMALTEDHETLILGDLPDNEASVTMMGGDPEIHEAVLAFQTRIRKVINRLVVFCLCLEYPDGFPACLRVFAMFCMANAAKEHRSRLVRLLTHPSVITKESEPDKQDSKTRAKLECLMASHVEPGLVAVQVASRVSTSTPETSDQTGAGDIEPVTAFQLRDKGKGEPKVRCNRCEEEGLVCKLLKNTRGRCEECSNNSLDCTRPDLTKMNLYGAGICDRCGEWKRDLNRHRKDCVGTLQPDEGFVSQRKTCEDCSRSFTAGAFNGHQRDSC
ncbi:unnamed protein product [Fusarium langsethiae]|nr:unnamed protein product [Fusarium langsethiae]